jgi:hypothetical protein
MTNDELIEYYTDLLILQYRSKPKAADTIRATIRSIMIYELIDSVSNAYNIDNAVGVQLDVIGLYLGIDRIVTGASFTRNYFGFSEYGDIEPFTFYPFMKYGNEVPGVQFRSYKESKQSLFTLNDEEFRTILKLKIGQNNSNYSTKDIDDFLLAFFGDNVIFTDRKNMTISYIFDKSVERLVTIAASENLIPKPAAVGVSISFTEDVENIFTFSTYGGTFPNYGVGFAQYGQPKTGGMAVYGAIS